MRSRRRWQDVMTDFRMLIPEIRAAQRERRKAGVRSTSTEVYRRLEDSGFLEKRRGKVYQFLFWNGPLTVAETIEELEARSGRKGAWRINSSGRFTELRTMGAIQEMGQATCTVTGENVILWDVTDREPGPLPTRVTGLTRNQLLDRVAELEEEVTTLRSRLQRMICKGAHR